MTTNIAAPQRLYLMQVAALPQINIPIVCYLVQTGDGTNILIDSGLPEGAQPPPGVPMPVMGQNVLEQLAQLASTLRASTQWVHALRGHAFTMGSPRLALPAGRR